MAQWKTEVAKLLSDNPEAGLPGSAKAGMPDRSHFNPGEFGRRAVLPAFERYVGIDYSGAQTPKSSLRGLRVYAANCLPHSYLHSEQRLNGATTQIDA
jgi:hypothetical protein